uniref:FA complementation group C n=1 Tax=Oncorhynchus mykiss TaxID=8022 RepID=A0A8C7RPQ2_ONCMY
MAGLKPQEVAFWLGKAVEWGQTESPDTQRDTCLHLGPLRAFLQLLLTDIHMRSSTTETMRTIPFVGQFLGRLCWNPYVTADAESRSLLLQSLWSLYSEEPHNAVERKANHVLAASVACVPLVTCPETAPLIGALLQRPVTCDKAALSQDFLDAVSSAYSRKCVSLEAQAVVSLWCHNLASLEGAVMSLLDSVLSNPACIPHNLENTITHSLLVFMHPSHLLPPPPEMAQEAWPEHLAWITASLQRLTEEEEEVFEAWFLLVQCADWLEVANQLLVSARPQDCGPLLWLLTFYHHPTNRGHQRTQQLVAAREVWDHLRSLFLLSAPPLPADRLQSLAELMSAVPQQPSLDSLLVVSLLGNFAVFSHNPLSGAREIVRMVS